MGYLTTIVFHNDAYEVFKENMEETVKNILAAMQKYNSDSYAVGSHCNPMTAMGSSHADDPRLFLQTGNSLFEIGYKTNVRDIEYRKYLVKLAQELVRAEKKQIALDEKKIKARESY